MNIFDKLKLLLDTNLFIHHFDGYNSNLLLRDYKYCLVISEHPSYWFDNSNGQRVSGQDVFDQLPPEEQQKLLFYLDLI